jgi:hypothetical protein
MIVVTELFGCDKVGSCHASLAWWFRASPITSPSAAAVAKRSSHLGLGGDGLTETAALLDRWPDWRTVLGGGLDPALREEIRKRELHGHPLGDEAFLARLAASTSRRLGSLRRGRPKRSGQ